MAKMSCFSIIASNEKMPTWTWDECCESAVRQAKLMGMSFAKTACTVKASYRKFQQSQKFRICVSKKHDLPPFLQQNPDICTMIKTYTQKNLPDLSIEFLAEYIHTTIIPKW